MENVGILFYNQTSHQTGWYKFEIGLVADFISFLHRTQHNAA